MPNIAIEQYIDEFKCNTPNVSDLTANPDQILLGPNAVLDSVDFVEFVLGLEEFIENNTGTKTYLMNEEWLTDENVILTIEDLLSTINKKLD